MKWSFDVFASALLPKCGVPVRSELAEFDEIVHANTPLSKDGTSQTMPQDPHTAHRKPSLTRRIMKAVRERPTRRTVSPWRRRDIALDSCSVQIASSPLWQSTTSTNTGGSSTISTAPSYDESQHHFDQWWQQPCHHSLGVVGHRAKQRAVSPRAPRRESLEEQAANRSPQRVNIDDDTDIPIDVYLSLVQGAADAKMRGQHRMSRLRMATAF